MSTDTRPSRLPGPDSTNFRGVEIKTRGISRFSKSAEILRPEKQEQIQKVLGLPRLPEEAMWLELDDVRLMLIFVPGVMSQNAVINARDDSLLAVSRDERIVPAKNLTSNLKRNGDFRVIDVSGVLENQQRGWKAGKLEISRARSDNYIVKTNLG